MGKGLTKTLRAVLTAVGLGPPVRLDGPASFVDFLRTRSARVAQSTLYGYLKTRMGTRYPALFEDPEFADAIRTAQEKVFVACLSDLTLFAIIKARPAEADPAACAMLAAWSFGCAGASTAMNAFQDRLEQTEWTTDPAACFSESPVALVQAAPVIEAFKLADAEILRNSIEFQWIDVKRELQEGLTPDLWPALIAVVSAPAEP
ncbi:MAG: hypothetical protein AAF439_04700 [Pseudomonadota bacterium]